LITLWNQDYLSKQLQLLPKAEEMGFSEVWSGIGKETAARAKEVSKVLSSLGFYYVVDVSPDVFRQLGASPRDLRVFKDLGIQGLRADWGFNLDELAEMANNDLGLKVELNASVFPTDLLDSLLKRVRDVESLMASHDFYPWDYTGISLESLVAKSREFHQRGIPVAAFVVRKGGLRTTVESLRRLEVGASASILFNTGVVDRVWLGEPEPTEEELREVGQAAKVTKIRVIVYPGLTEEERKVFGTEFRDVRIKETTVGMIAAGENRIGRRNIVRRFRGAVCVINDNPHYLQVWIFKGDGEANQRFNVIGEVLEEDMEVVERLGERTRSTFSVVAEETFPPVRLEPLFDRVKEAR